MAPTLRIPKTGATPPIPTHFRCVANEPHVSSNRGGDRVLAASFTRSAGDEAACSEILSALACTLPLGDEACRQIVDSSEALRTLVSILRSGDSAGRLNAVLVVKELAADRGRAAAVAVTEGLVEAIAKLIKERASPRTTKASLVAAYYLASASGRARSGFARSSAVPSLLEILVESERSVCEKALGALDAVLGDEEAREEAREHALAVPVLVKRMFRVSEIATEFAVSGLWKLCCRSSCCDDDGERRRGLARAALSVGAFQKLLLLLQVGCSEGTKEKASELLRMLNGCRGGEEYCVDSADFRGLKRNF
ncbi:putative U-box domain-containing protein 21 [Iris pallida]|uniref:U-box domain-containing protein n=1 Tax=Iris pallida TaxID=29817 RepID=A0AAX6EAA2_IRIPA|nr:putative U-box domain-containing protein 21 [Iris pallida]